MVKIVSIVSVAIAAAVLNGSEVTRILEAFPAPPVAYSTMPLWVWNDEVTEEKIDRDLLSFKENGISGAFVHPRPGLITSYLSEEWFELWSHACEKADELEMELWIYDENSYPSGFAGGHVPKVNPESVSHPTALTMEKLDTVEGAELSDYVYVVETEQSSRLGGSRQGSRSNLHSVYGFREHEQEPSGWFGGTRYVDLLIPGVTETFIDVTMSGYEAALGDKLGTVTPGIFTDEPNIRAFGSREGIRITPSLWRDFESRWGYDLIPNLPSLFEEVGDWKKARHNYYRLLLELFIDRWSKPWHAYTEEKGLKWTGHYWEHGWPNPGHGGDNMAMYAWHQRPAIDMLFNDPVHRRNQFGNARAVKELSSVANQLGKDRTLSETHGGAGWDLSFSDMKRLNDWQFALGVNSINQHLSSMTLKGRRKGDYPQSFSYHAPYWKDYKVLANYLHRVSYVLSQGRQINRILVIEPTTTAWMYYSPVGSSAHLDAIEHSFRSLLDEMESMQIEYDLASENIIKDHGSVEGGTWRIGAAEYDVVILPKYIESIDSETAIQLREYLRSGGRLLHFGDLPRLVDGAPSELLRGLFEMKAANVSSIRSRSIEVLADTLPSEELSSRGFVPINPASYGGQAHHMRRRLESGDEIIFWSNFSQSESAQVEFLASGQHVTVLDPMTGTFEAKDFQRLEDQVRVAIDLPPAGSFLCIVSDEKLLADRPAASGSDAEWNALPGRTHIELMKENTLSIDYVDIRVGNSVEKGVYFNDAANKAFRENGLPRYSNDGFNPWQTAVQFETNVLDMAAYFAPDSGFEAEYHFKLESGLSLSSLQAVVEWPQLYDIKINGSAVAPLKGNWWLDEGFGVIELAPHLEDGWNTLSLSIQPMSIHAEVEPVYLKGEFSVGYSESGFVLKKPHALGFGAWKDQGYPMYSYDVTYSREITVSQGSDYKVSLGEWNGTVARICVNSQVVGHLFKPFTEFNVTKWLNPGINEIELQVVGSLQNLLGPHHSGPKSGFVTPWKWMEAPDVQPPGSAYHFVSYGLLEDFEVLERKRTR